MATHHDAELILKLYDLRREPEMRKARNFLGFDFWPTSFEEIQKITGAAGTDNNRYFRQATSFWEMAAQLVLHGTLDEKLFIDTAGEMFFIFAKFKPFLAEMRQSNPVVFHATEAVINRSEEGRKKLAVIEQRVAAVKQMAAQRAKA